MLVTKRIILRPLEIKDIDIIAEWRNNPEIHKNFFSHKFIIKSNQENWYKSLLISKEKMLFTIVEREKKNTVGFVGFDHIDYKNQQAEYGNLLIGGNNTVRKGYATEATLILLKYGFYELNIHRIYLKVFEWNKLAIQFYKKCGFIKEGILREANYSQGKFQNILLMSILRREFQKQ